MLILNIKERDSQTTQNTQQHLFKTRAVLPNTVAALANIASLHGHVLASATEQARPHICVSFLPTAVSFDLKSKSARLRVSILMRW